MNSFDKAGFRWKTEISAALKTATLEATSATTSPQYDARNSEGRLSVRSKNIILPARVSFVLIAGVILSLSLTSPGS